jgi:hypothetical protein
MEKRPPIWSEAESISNKQSRTADKGWPSSLGCERDTATPRLKNWPCYETDICSSGLRYDLSNEKGT